jgi:hypothetical protein
MLHIRILYEVRPRPLQIYYMALIPPTDATYSELLIHNNNNNLIIISNYLWAQIIERHDMMTYEVVEVKLHPS